MPASLKDRIRHGREGALVERLTHRVCFTHVLHGGALDGVKVEGHFRVACFQDAEASVEALRESKLDLVKAWIEEV